MDVRGEGRERGNLIEILNHLSPRGLLGYLCYLVASTEKAPPAGEIITMDVRHDYDRVVRTSVILSLLSGMVNGLAFLEMGMTVAHQTDNLSHWGRLSGTAAIEFGSVLFSFCPGAFAAGWCRNSKSACRN